MSPCLNTHTGYGVPLQADIPVTGMMSKLQSAHPERRAELLELLGIDPNWRMNRVSDGQRRRVQLFLGLVRPFDILLLDEVGRTGHNWGKSFCMHLD